MNETNIILIVSLVLFSSTIGVYGLVKIIKNNTSSPFNTLTRRGRGDIELVEYNEPTIPEQAHHPSELLKHHINSVEIIPSNDVPSFNLSNVPTSPIRWERYNINCCLENEINIDFIWGLIFIIMILIIYYFLSTIKRNNGNKIVFTEGISTNIITFTEDYQDLLSSKITDGVNYHIIYEKPDYYTLPHHWTLFDIKDWLDSLNVQDYAVTFHLSCLPSQELYYNTPDIILTNEFMVNKSSNPALISVLLYQQLDFFYNSFNVGYYENHSIIIRYKPLTAAP